MHWLQLQVQTTANNAETLSDLLTLAGAAAVTFIDATDEPIFEPAVGTTPLWTQTKAIGLFEPTVDIEKIQTFLKRQLGTNDYLDFRVEPLEDKDWLRTWMDNFHPMCFGQRLWICPPQNTILEPNAIVVTLEPGLAFGTGTHPTTSLCLQWLDANITHGETVIDFGCGSGILAIAALKLGATQAFATDHDPQALLATQSNALINNISSGQLFTSLPTQLPDVKADVLIANILATPLIELANVFAKHVKHNGKIVLSGILEDQLEKVRTAYLPWFSFLPATVQEDWVRLEGIRNSASAD